MQSPVNEFSECNECGAAKGVECNDCLSHSSRIHNFIAKASFDERLKAQQLTYNNLPDFIKELALQEEDSLFLNKEEHSKWKEIYKLEKK